ncbi:MAG: NAD(P)/FAD-dependent oxidoreductase [Gemmatimonadota bacterium]
MKSGPKTVAVIGAGAAGLSAAWRLLAAGCTVTLYERRSEAGGRLRTDELEGVRFDAGVQLFGSNYTSWFELARAAGAGDQVVRSPGRDAVWRRGRANPLTYGSVASMITSNALPTTLKLKLAGKYLPFLTRHAMRLDLHELVKTGGVELDTESIAAWGERELGHDFVDLLAYPLLGAYYGSAPEETSAAVYHALARVGLDVAVYAARDGMGRLAAAVAAGVRERGAILRYDTRIERLNWSGYGITLEAGRGAERFDAVIIAVPAVEAQRLLAESAVAPWLTGVRATPTCTLALVLKESVPVDYFGLSIPRGDERGPVVAICMQERKVRGLVPPGKSALVVIPAPEQATVLSALEPPALLERCLPMVERVIPGVRSLVVRARMTAFPEGYTIFYPGYVKHLRSFKPEVVPARCALAGDYLVAPTVEGAVRSGAAAANRVLASVG